MPRSDIRGEFANAGRLGLTARRQLVGWRGPIAICGGLCLTKKCRRGRGRDGMVKEQDYS
jgi:hypothetical protein